jgi:ATP-binding cassette, subfamily G (WHITE), member 2
VVDILARLGGRGVNAVLSIHQPRFDILRMLERVVLLSATGTLLFSGPVGSIASHLDDLNIPVPPNTLNVADFLLDSVITASDAEVARMAAHFAACGLRRQEAAAVAAWPQAHSPLQPKYTASFWRQLRLLSVSLLRNAYRHPFLTATSYVATLVAAVALGVAFWDSGIDTPVRCRDVPCMFTSFW